MATVGALKRRAEELRTGINNRRYEIEAFARGNAAYPGGSPNSGGNNQYTPYYDAQYQLEEGNILGQKARAQSNARSASGRLESTVRNEKSAVQKLREKALKQNTVSMADQGILRSGINIGQQAEIGTDYLDAIKEISQGAAMSQEDIDMQLAQEESSLNTQMMNAQLLRMQRETEYRLQQALREAELKADQEALAATEAEIKEAQDAAKLKASANGKYAPKNSVKKVSPKKGTNTSQKHWNSVKNKKFTPAQLKARKKARLAAKKKK